MQKSLSAMFALLLASFSIILSPCQTFGNKDDQIPTILQNTNANQASVSATVKYDLPFPGILPDNPLYKLKVLRDKISLALINDPRKKIDFYLLLTDKGILASAMLVDKNKIDLAVETALKAEHNYTLLTMELYRLPKKPDDNFFDKLEKASLKHQEVLSSLIKRLTKDQKKTFITVFNFAKKNMESVEKYKNSDNITK